MAEGKGCRGCAELRRRVEELERERDNLKEQLIANAMLELEVRRRYESLLHTLGSQSATSG